MCGIIGFNWEDKNLVKKMASKLSHRGPDDSGFFLDKNVSLGHHRLSIIDTSKKGHQPMFNEDGKIVVVYNGEIWNYQTLKQDLEKKSHIFKSSSDTEVIIHGYEEYGDKIFEMLDGMFTIALWDIKSKKLILARDKIGKKPLYYYFEKGKLIFASEIKALLVHDFKTTINEECLSNYLTLRFSPDTKTMFNEVKKVPPGSFLTLQNKEITLKKYYSLPSFTPKYAPEESKAENLISESIRKRLIADVPIGVFLSGGLDSSTLVAYMSRFSKNIQTFSVGFSSKVDETKYAELIAKKFKTKHTKITLGEEMLNELPKIIWHFDEPLADPAALPTYLLCQEVSKHVKVALSGEGGDEVFGGYQSFNYIPQIKAMFSIPFLVRKHLFSKIFYMFSTFYEYPKKHEFLAISEILKKRTLKEGYKELFYFPFNSQEKREIFSKNKEDVFDTYMKENKLDVLAQKFYFNEWLPNDLLMKADKMGMAHGLEIRTPFLDKDLIDYFAGLDYKEKRKRKLFRKIVSKVLPIEIMNKKKQGFTLPLFDWFSNKQTFERILPFIENLKSRKIFNNDYINDLLINPTKFKNEHKLWVLLNFEIWCQIYLDGKDYRRIKL